MDVIKITPAELRDMAQGFKRAAQAQERCLVGAIDSDDRDAFRAAMETATSYREKLVKLADKLDRDNMDALAFCAPAQGVQA